MVSVSKIKRYLVGLLGINQDGISAAEKLVATIGSFLGITAITYISYQYTGLSGAAIIVPSMGASAVLVFAVPHGRLSQPWALFGGNTLSAIVGVTCYMHIPNLFIAAGVAVSMAIGVMHVTKCLHPPGGASALAAVVGGQTIHELGYQYVLTPVLLNTIIIFCVAILFNNMFPWRRYPANFMKFKHLNNEEKKDQPGQLDKAHIEQAISDLDLVIDVTTEDLHHLMKLSLEHAEKQRLVAADIILGHYYANGKHGGEWSIRQIIDESSSPDPEKDMVIFRVVEGNGLRQADSCTRDEFARWASHEVFETSR